VAELPRITADDVRRGLHLLSPVFLLYYLLPLEVLPGVRREAFVVLATGIVIGFEGVRLVRHWEVPGLRDYERHRLAGYAWGGFGLALGLLFFPPVLHALTFCGMAWVDPLCRWSRERRLYPRVPLVAYLGGGLLLLAALTPFHGAIAARPILMAPVAFISALVAVAVEHKKWTWTDDDFLMNVAPLALLTLLVGY